MVLYILKWNIHPDQMKPYLAWARGAVARALAVPGVLEIRGYRPVTGASQTVMTYECADLASWQAWYEHQDIQALMLELRAFTTDMNMELWGTSPVIPSPIRAGA